MLWHVRGVWSWRCVLCTEDSVLIYGLRCTGDCDRGVYDVVACTEIFAIALGREDGVSLVAIILAGPIPAMRAAKFYMSSIH